MFDTLLCVFCGCVANQCVCVRVCTHVCVSSPTAGFRVTIQHPPLHLHPVPFAACVACLIPSPSCSSISLLRSAPPLSPPPLLCFQPTCVCRGGCGAGGATRGDDGAQNQPLVSLKQQCIDADDAKSNANCICITKAIWDSKKREVHKTHKDLFFFFLQSGKIMFKWAALIRNTVWEILHWRKKSYIYWCKWCRTGCASRTLCDSSPTSTYLHDKKKSS